MASKLKWYHEGLRFQCTGCGQCCTGFPGAVWVSDQEIKQLADHKNLSVEAFTENYLRRLDGKWSLKECSTTYDCVFLKGKQCTVYEHRPKQCRTFPWWPQNLKSEKNWKEAARGCEGIHSDAPVVSFEDIQKQLNHQEES